MGNIGKSIAAWTKPGMAPSGGSSAYRNRPKRTGQTPEARVLHAVGEYLKRKNIFHWRQSVGVVKTDHGFMSFGAPGQPDFMAVVDGRFIAIEVKSSVGRQSDTQKAWQTRCERAGARYILARSVDDIAASGL